MKKTLLTIGVVAALFSCSKEDEVTMLEATDLTGTAILSGTITGDNPAKNWTESGITGVTVSVRVDNSELYPNSSTSSGSEVFTGTTDVNGKYSIPVTVYQEGSQVNVTFNNITLIDPTDGYSYLYFDDNTVSGNYTLYAGVTKNLDTYYDYSEYAYPSTSPIEDAEVRGTIFIEKSLEYATGLFKDTLYGLDGYTVTLLYDYDPATRMPRTYTTTTDANGDYSFIIDAANRIYNLDDDFEIMIPNYNNTFDTIMQNGTTITGPAGYYRDYFTNGSIDGGDIINDWDLYYDRFYED